MIISQNFPNLGSQDSFDFMTWNIEWFPKNGQTTINYVAEIIEDIDVDVIAMQELDDRDLFDQMISSLDGYAGYYDSSWFAGLAFIYNTETVQVNDIYEIYTTSPYWNAFPRSPMVMDLNFNGVNYFLINNHFKCCGDGSLDLNDDSDEEKAQEERVLTAEILALEKKLYRGDGESKPKLSDGRKLAVQMRNKRLKLRDLIADRISMDENTVEALADNAKFDYLVATCSFYTEGDRPIFANYEDYNKRSSDEVSIAAAQLLAKMIYQLDKNFENNLPENRFLKQFNLIDDAGMLVDPNNQDVFVDANGRRISASGHYLDEDGNRVDVNGEPLDDAGFYALTEYEDDLSEEKKAPAKKTTRKRRTTKKQQTSTTE